MSLPPLAGIPRVHSLEVRQLLSLVFPLHVALPLRRLRATGLQLRQHVPRPRHSGASDPTDHSASANPVAAARTYS